MRRLVVPLLGLGLVVVLVIGLTQAGGKSNDGGTAPRVDPPAAKRTLQSAPPPLASLYDQASTILEGGPSAFHERIATLKGHPAVINKWASWCRPCRAEFPIFQQVATDRGKQIA